MIHFSFDTTERPRPLLSLELLLFQQQHGKHGEE